MNKQTSKKIITIAVPVYNEQESLQELYKRTTAVMGALGEYDTELVFFDDGSADASRSMIERLCREDTRCKAVFFAHNYGYNKAIFYAMQQAKGDCAVLLHADLQNPPELIPAFVKEWEQGHDVVFGVKSKSKENKFMFFVRTLFYLAANLLFGMKLIPHATDFELVDKERLAALKEIRQTEPILRILLQEAAQNKKLIHYTQEKRLAGESNFNFKKYLKLARSWIRAQHYRSEQAFELEEEKRINY